MLPYQPPGAQNKKWQMTSCLSGGFHCRGRSETFYYCCQTQTSVTHVLHAVTCHVAIKETSDCKWTSRGRRPAGGGTHRSSLLMSLPALWKICLCNIFCWNLRVSIVHPVPSSAIWFPHTGTQTHRRGGGGGRREHGRAPPRVNGFSPHWKTQLSKPGSLSRHHATAGRHQKAPVTADHMVTWFYLWPCSHGCDHSIMFLTNISLVEGSSGTFSSIAVKLTCICHFIRYTW